MADEEQQQAKQRGFLSTITKRALAPVVATAATAGTGYALRKGSDVWEQKLRPKVQELGGFRMLARETLEHAAARIGGPVSEKIAPVSEKIGALGEKVGIDDAGEESPAPEQAGEVDDAKREQDRQERERRRKERRRALEQARQS